MEAAASDDLFNKNQLSNRKQSLVESFKDTCPTPFFFSINILVQAAVTHNYK